MCHLNQLYSIQIPLCITGENAEIIELRVIYMKKKVKKEVFPFTRLNSSNKKEKIDLDFHSTQKNTILWGRTLSFYEMAPRDSWHIHNVATTLESNEYKYTQQNLSLRD